MKQHPEALNYSWDGSQQTLNSTWGNTAVTLQLILLLNPAADCSRESVCVCFFLSFFFCARVCFLYLLETCSDEALTHTRSHAGSFKPTNSMCQEKQQVSPSAPCLSLDDWFGTQKLKLSVRTCTRYENTATVAEVNRRVWNETIKCRCHSSNKQVLRWCAFFLSYLQHDCCCVYWMKLLLRSSSSLLNHVKFTLRWF